MRHRYGSQLCFLWKERAAPRVPGPAPVATAAIATAANPTATIAAFSTGSAVASQPTAAAAVTSTSSAAIPAQQCSYALAAFRTFTAEPAAAAAVAAALARAAAALALAAAAIALAAVALPAAALALAVTPTAALAVALVAAVAAAAAAATRPSHCPHHGRCHVRGRLGDNEPLRLLGGDRRSECGDWKAWTWDDVHSILLV